RPAAQRLEQGGPLPQHPLVVRPDPGVAGRPGDQQVIEVAAALLGVPLDQGQVLLGEQHRAQRAEHLARPRHPGAVEPGPVGAAGVALDLRQAVRARGGPRPAQDGPFRPVPHQGRVAGHPVAAERGQVADRLHHVRLALAVGPDKRAHPWLQAEIDRREGPEIREGEAAHVHMPRLLAYTAAKIRAAPARPSPRSRAPGREGNSRGVSSRAGWPSVAPGSVPEAVTACPPNWLRKAATTFIAGESSWRETNRAYRAALIAGIGTAWSIAACTVHRPSPESWATPRMFFRPGSSLSALHSRSSSQERMTVPWRQLQNAPATSV